MHRKIFKIGNKLVVSLPKDATDEMQISEGTMVSMYFDRVTRKLVIEPVQSGPGRAAKGINEEFAQQISEFIDEYRPALDELAK